MFKKIVVVAGIIFSASAFAQAEKFSGLSVGLNTGFQTNSTKVSAALTTLAADLTPINFDATYSFALSPVTTLGLGLTYDLSDATLYKGTAGDNIIGNTTWKLKSHYSINLEPGYVFNNNVLAYAKVAYHSGKSNVSVTGLSLNQSVSGWGYGFGAKFQLDKNLYMKIEAQQINYSTFTADTTTVEHKSTIGTIGLGYQF